jgi:hypothetical protein
MTGQNIPNLAFWWSLVGTTINNLYEPEGESFTYSIFTRVEPVFGVTGPWGPQPSWMLSQFSPTDQTLKIYPSSVTPPTNAIKNTKYNVKINVHDPHNVVSTQFDYTIIENLPPVNDEIADQSTLAYYTDSVTYSDGFGTDPNRDEPSYYFHING